MNVVSDHDSKLYQIVSKVYYNLPPVFLYIVEIKMINIASKIIAEEVSASICVQYRTIEVKYLDFFKFELKQNVKTGVRNASSWKLKSEFRNTNKRFSPFQKQISDDSSKTLKYCKNYEVRENMRIYESIDKSCI